MRVGGVDPLPVGHAELVHVGVVRRGHVRVDVRGICQVIVLRPVELVPVGSELRCLVLAQAPEGLQLHLGEQALVDFLLVGAVGQLVVFVVQVVCSVHAIAEQVLGVLAGQCIVRQEERVDVAVLGDVVVKHKKISTERLREFSEALVDNSVQRLDVGLPVWLVVQLIPVLQQTLVELPDRRVDRARRVLLELGRLRVGSGH